MNSGFRVHEFGSMDEKGPGTLPEDRQFFVSELLFVRLVAVR
jgi:hypothetical protein